MFREYICSYQFVYLFGFWKYLAHFFLISLGYFVYLQEFQQNILKEEIICDFRGPDQHECRIVRVKRCEWYEDVSPDGILIAEVWFIVNKLIPHGIECLFYLLSLLVHHVYGFGFRIVLNIRQHWYLSEFHRSWTRSKPVPRWSEVGIYDRQFVPLHFGHLTWSLSVELNQENRWFNSCIIIMAYQRIRFYIRYYGNCAVCDL